MNRFVKSTLLASAMLLSALPALADAKTESYVQKNASEVLQTLNKPELTTAERTAKFSTYMDQFTDLDKVSDFVLGKYRSRFTEAELATYRKAFREYALAVYESELDAYRGKSVVVKRSTDRKANDSIVVTEIQRQDGKNMEVQWRVMGTEGEYQVVDVALNLDGNLLWLAGEQRKQFLAFLDSNKGSAAKLTAEINRMTKDLKTKSRS